MHRHLSFPITRVNLTFSTTRPTVETRNALYTTASRQAEDVRVQLRKLHQALLKKADVSKHSADFSTVSGWARVHTTRFS